MKNLLILLFGIVFGGLAIWAIFYLQQNYKITKNNNLPSQYPLVTQEAQVTNNTDTPVPTANEVTVGYVEGSISYPSEGIPSNLQVCAETTGGVLIKCTGQIKDGKYQYGTGYKLELNPGTYNVYANIPNNPYKAYYTEFVTCGLMASCPSHARIMVTVTAGETVSKVDPQDWYNQ